MNGGDLTHMEFVCSFNLGPNKLLPVRQRQIRPATTILIRIFGDRLSVVGWISVA